jgi:hypothetical protein
MKEKSMFYVYDKNNQVVQIRTKIMNTQRPIYVIQYPFPRKSPEDRIRYRSEFVDEHKFYAPLNL